MVEATKELSEQVNELMELTVNMIGVQDFKDMNPEAFRALQLMLNITDTANTILIKQAEAMVNIEKKIDTLLSKKVES